ncbi:MAG: hypothetical protein JWN01_1090 [Patescibacteria group bacterium]|nr:hypothetical protein [Patescibacteria group bacterium]
MSFNDSAIQTALKSYRYKPVSTGQCSAASIALSRVLAQIGSRSGV